MQASLDEWYMPRTVGAPLSGVPDYYSKHRSLPAKLLGDARSYARGFVRYFTVLGSGEYPLILGIRYHRHNYLALREASLGAWVGATLRNRSSPSQRAIVVGIVAWLLALYAAAARGLWRALRERRWFASTLLLATIGYFMVATGPIAREARYRLPALVAIAVLAGVGVTVPRTQEAASSPWRE